MASANDAQGQMSLGGSLARVRVKPWLPAALFALSALLVVLPLILRGCSCGHDFDFHLLSWMEAANQWKHGILKPVWAFTPAFNAGEPRLLMYPPLSWVTGAAIGMVLPWPAVPIAFTWLVLFLSGVTMYRLLQRWTSPTVAMLGGCLYMVNPYMLFCAYERAAYAELMAAAWMPLLLAAMLRRRPDALRLTFVVALLWLTNAPAAVVGSYSMLLLGLGRLVVMHREGIRAMLRFALTVALGFCTGLLADSFYLLPMALTRKYVQLALAVVPIASPDANFLFAHDNDAFHDRVLLQASWIATATLIAAALCGGALLWSRLRARRTIRPQHSMKMRETSGQVEHSGTGAVATLTAFSLVLWFLLSRWSSRIWHLAPELVFLQFPWRFLTIGSAVAVVLLILLLQRGDLRWRLRVVLAVALPIVALAGYFGGGCYFREECADDETVQAQRTQFVEEDGVGPTDEYTPVDADNDVLPVHLPEAWMGEAMDADPDRLSKPLHVQRGRLDDLQIATQASPSDALLIVRLRDFPGWQTLRDGLPITPRIRPDGLIVVPLPAGQAHEVEVRYRTPWDQWTGLGVSGATLLVLAGVRRRQRSGIIRSLA